jgi:hypothetical protein
MLVRTYPDALGAQSRHFRVSRAAMQHSQCSVIAWHSNQSIFATDVVVSRINRALAYFPARSTPCVRAGAVQFRCGSDRMLPISQRACSPCSTPRLPICWYESNQLPPDAVTFESTCSTNPLLPPDCVRAFGSHDTDVFDHSRAILSTRPGFWSSACTPICALASPASARCRC